MSSGQRDPRMDEWIERSVRYRSVWTGRGQGVAADGTSWFVTQNDRRPGLSRYSADFKTVEAQVDIPRTVAGHVGAVSVFEEEVYVALENDESLITYSRDLAERSRVKIKRPLESDQKRHLSWCAINPANRLLYTCNWNNAVRLDAYDPETGAARPDHDIELSESVHRTQGGVFSNAGNVYLASDDIFTFREQIKLWLRQDVDREIFPGIHGFDAATGARCGYTRVPTRPHFPHFEEIEGMGAAPMTIDGSVAHVHLALLDKNHSWILDDVHIKSFTVPEPGKI